MSPFSLFLLAIFLFAILLIHLNEMIFIYLVECANGMKGLETFSLSPTQSHALQIGFFSVSFVLSSSNLSHFHCFDTTSDELYVGSYNNNNELLRVQVRTVFNTMEMDEMLLNQHFL